MTPDLWQRIADAFTRSRATPAEREVVRNGAQGRAVRSADDMPPNARDLLIELEHREPLV